MLLQKAEHVWTRQLKGEQAHDEVKAAVASIDELTGTANNVPEHVRQLADSIASELHAYDAAVFLADGYPANAVVAFRDALERAEGSPGLAERVRGLTDALASAQKSAGDVGSARVTYDDAVKKAEAGRDTASIRHFLVQKALFCSELRDYHEVIDINLRILEMDKRSGDTRNEISTELRLSKAYEKLNGMEAFAHATSAY